MYENGEWFVVIVRRLVMPMQSLYEFTFYVTSREGLTLNTLEVLRSRMTTEISKKKNLYQ